ncbi:MAG TPA: enoyl-CoA hydratase-related protein, partial [Acidimicrobiales bacterium]|nr:enoyl-CoA hydratase-related protein [Acidimicrobiales bacterium]
VGGLSVSRRCACGKRKRDEREPLMADIDTGTQDLLADLSDGVLTLTLNRPQARNAMSGEMNEALAAQLAWAERASEVKCVVLTGAGKGFCAGADLGDLGSTDGPGFRSIYEGFLRVGRSSLPVLAAVNGAAVGAGMNMALCADLRVAGRSARFDCRFMDLGLHPGGGHTWMLRDAVGKSNAAAMVLFGQILDGDAAAAAGLVWECVDDAALIDRSVEIAARAASGPKLLVHEIKSSLRDMRAIDDHDEAVDRELTPQLWSTKQPWFRERLAAIQARVQSKKG